MAYVTIMAAVQKEMCSGVSFLAATTKRISTILEVVVKFLTIKVAKIET